MAQINTGIFLEKSSQKCADVDFEMDDEFAGFLEQLEAIPIELADENCVNNFVEEIKTDNSEMITETDNVLQKEISVEKKKQLSILSDSLESGECCSSECESLDSKAGLLKGRSLYQQVLNFKAERLKRMHKFELSSAEISEKNELILPGKARSRKDSSSSYSSSLSGKETIILPLNDNLPLTALDETDIMEEKSESRNLAASPSLEFEDCLNSNPPLKEKMLPSFHKHVKQEMLLFENKLSHINLNGLDNVDNLLKVPETMKKYSAKARTLSEDKDTSSLPVIQSASSAVDYKAEISRKKSPSFSPISNSSSTKLEKKKDVLSLSSISPPTDENDPLGLSLNAISSKPLILQRELKDYGSLSPEPSSATTLNSSKREKVKKKKRKKSKRKARSKSKSKENEKPSGKKKTYSRSPVRQKTRSRSRSVPIKEGQNRLKERHYSSFIEKSSSRCIERRSKSRSSSVERSVKRQKQSFTRSRSRSRPTEKGSLERQRQYYKRSRSRSYEKGAYRNRSFRRSPARRRSRTRSNSVERRKLKRQKWYDRKTRSRSRSIERRGIKRRSRSKSTSPCKSVCRSPKRKRSLSKTPPGLRKTSSSMSISPLTSDENTIFTSIPAVSEKLATLPCMDVNPPFSQPQPIPSVVGIVAQPTSTMGNHINYYDNYCYSQDVPYIYPSSMHMPETQLPYYHPPEQNYWNPEIGLQDSFSYNQQAQYNQQAHHNQQTNLREIILSATPLPPLPTPLPSVPPFPPLPPSEPAPPPPPPPEADSSLISTPEKAKPSRLISRLKSNLRYILPEITKKVHSEEVVKLIDRSLQSPQKVSPSASSSSSLGEEFPKDRKEQAEKYILEKLQEVTFESTSASKDHKPSSKPEVRQPVQMLACNSTCSKEAHGNKSNSNVIVETQIVPSVTSEQDTVTKQNKPYAIVKPKPNSKYSPVVLKLLHRQKLVPNNNFIDTEIDQETTVCNTYEQRVIEQTPFQPGHSSNRSSLILINTSGTLPSEEKNEQSYSESMKNCSPGLAKESNTVFSFPKEDKLENNHTNNSKEKEITNTAVLICNSIKDDKSKSPHHVANVAFSSNDGNVLENKTKIKLDYVPQEKSENYYKSKGFKSATVAEIGIICNKADKDIYQSEHMTAFTNDSNKTEDKMCNYSSQNSKTHTSTIVYKDNVTTATIIGETNTFGKEKQKPVIEKVFEKNLGGIETSALGTVSHTATKAEKNVKSENVYNTVNTTRATLENVAANGIAEETSKSTLQREYGQNLGCSWASTSFGANATTKTESKTELENTSQNSESVLQNAKNSTVSHDESITKEVSVTRITSGNMKDGISNGHIENETSEPMIQSLSENSFSNAQHKEEMQEATFEVCIGDKNKQSLQNINDKLEHTPNEAKLSATATNKESQEESKAFIYKKKELSDENLTQDVKVVKQKTAKFEQELSKSDYITDLKQNIRNPHSELPKQMKQERCTTTETYSAAKVSNEKQDTTTDATVSQNFHKNEKATSLDETDLKKMANKVVVSELSHTEKNTYQDRGAIKTQLKNEAQGNSTIIYKPVPDLPALSKLKTEASSSTETKFSLSKHKIKDNSLEHHPITKVDSLSTNQILKPTFKAKEQQKKIYSDSVSLNAENSQHKSALLKSTTSGGDAVSNIASPLILPNHHKSNAPGKKYKHRCHDKEQTSVLSQKSKITEIKQNIAEYGNRKSTNGNAESEKMDIDTAEGEKATKTPERLPASLESVGIGTKEAGDKLGESSKNKEYDMEYGITYKKQQRKKKEHSTTPRSTTMRLDHRKQIWEDPKLNMNVKIQLERCKAAVGRLNLAVKNHTSQTIIKTKQPQKGNVEVADKITPCTVLSLSADTTMPTYTSKNTKHFESEERKAKDLSRKSKSKKPKSKTAEDTSSAVQHLSRNISNHGSVKEESKDLSEIKAVYDRKSKLSALEKVISLLTVPRRSVSTQVRFKAKTLQGTHEVKDQHAPIRVDSTVISSLKELLHEYKTGS